MSFSHIDRIENFHKLKNEVFDLVIVGGGITGAGIARDAASRGMKVALVEAQDFASGTSSRSSKMIHGGVRYLENFEFGLVFEALAERALLFKIAPHLVHPLRFIIPIYKSSRVGMWKMRAGMWLYDLLALFETPQMHASLEAGEVREIIPGIDSRGLLGAMEYSDAYTDDDRLVIETLRDANRMGATSVNYLKVTGVNKSEDQISRLTVQDQISGESFSIQGRYFVSCVGPWTDIFGVGVDADWQKKLRPTKGVHLVFSKKTIPVEKAVVMAVEARIIFVIPRHEMVIVGTTDTDFSDDPMDVTTNIEDVNYILKALNQYFPSLEIDYHHILSTYCGVRPLVDDESSSESKTSREHSIWSRGPNLSFVAGGKYTTYRKISEETVDHILGRMPFEVGMSFQPSNTQKPLNPRVSQSLYERAQQRVTEWSKLYDLSSKLVATLVFRHGEEAEEILKKIKNDYGLYKPNEALWMGEADFAIKNTMCVSLKDFYWRRTPLFLATRDHGVRYLDVISKVFSEHFGWSAGERKRQQEKLMEQMQRELFWKANIEDL